MNLEQARQILLLYRPGTTDGDDPEIAAALDLAKREPELGRWFEQHCEFQRAMRSRLRAIEVPAIPRIQLPSETKIVRPHFSWWRQPVWLAAAAAVVLFIGLASLLWRPGVPDHFADFEDRMVSTALREYRMDIVTNDMPALRRFLAAKGGPADYKLTDGLQKLQLTGGGLLQWRSKPVSMVCFNRGDDQMLFLFVLDRSGVKDPPPPNPTVSRSHELVTVTWTQGDKAYLLAGPEEAEFLKKYL